MGESDWHRIGGKFLETWEYSVLLQDCEFYMDVNYCVCCISVYINLIQKKLKRNNNSGMIGNGQKYMKQNERILISVEAG